MNPILESTLLRREYLRQPTAHVRIPRLFWYLRSRRARWLRQCLNTLAWAVLAACLILALNACTAQGQSADNPNTIALHRQGDTLVIPPDSPLRQHLHLREASLQPLHDSLSALANVEAAPESLVRIIPPVTGRIVRLYVQNGDSVKQGDVLVSLDSAEIPALRGEYAKAQSALRQAEQEYARQQVLFDADIAARRELEAAQLELDAARADLAAAIGALHQFGISPETANSGHYLMRAPISGRILELDGAPGSYWNDTSDPLMVIADLQRLWLSAHVPEREIARIYIGQQARITFSARPDVSVTGQVQYIDDMIDPESRSVKVRVAVDNADGLLRPGMFAHLQFAAPPRQAVMIPASALLQGRLHSQVLVETCEGEFAPREVIAGAILGDQLEIRSGLAAGERVIVNAVEML